MKPRKTRRQQILVVEDSPTQAKLLQVMLDELNMDIEIVTTLAGCLEQLEQTRFDAVMLDLILPDSAGIETLVAVVDAQSGIPIVVLTSLEEEALGDDALKAGAEDYLVKGEVSPQQLARTLRYAIERKRQSNKLFESEKRLRTTIDNSYDAFVAIGENLEILEWNIKAEEMFGYSFREARRKNLTDIIHRDNEHISLATGLRRYFSGKESDIINQRCEVVGCHRGGREFPCEVAFFPVEQGQSGSLCTFISDITDRKEFENVTAEFYSTVAHELRAPLTSIKGSLSLMESGLTGELPEDAQELVRVGATSCERLVRLIGDLLDLSKFDAGKMPLVFTEISVADTVAQAVAECSGMASNHQITLVKDVSCTSTLFADVDRMTQVLVNLLSNAIKYSPVGGKVTISASSSGLGKVRFAVRDSGPGIAPEGIARLFQKFQQVQSGSDQKDGTGLGLAICKAIVSHHKGDIGVDSKVGEGATFWVELAAGTDLGLAKSPPQDPQAESEKLLLRPA